MLFLAASVIGHVCASMNSQIQGAPQRNSEPFVSHTPWKGLRVFADTSMLEADTEACNR